MFRQSFIRTSKDKRKCVNDEVLDAVAKDKPKGSASSVVALFQKDKALNVVSKDKPKGNASSELPNKKEKADIPKKPEVDYDSSSDEVSDRKPKKRKMKAEVKRKRKGGPDSDSDSFDEEDHSKKQKKLKRKRNDSDSDSSSIDRETMERMINKLQKKVKKESDEECVPRKGKNKEKQLTPEEAAYQEYLSTFPSFHARTTPVSLFSAIQNSSVDMLRFLNDIRFSSLNNVSIDKLPMKLGWFVVSRFKIYKLSFNTGDQIEVTHSKIHDMLGIPVGGYSLFKLDERETGDKFVKEWADQFSSIALKKIRVNDIAQKLSNLFWDVVKYASEDTVDFSDNDWCNECYDCLKTLLYLDSTNFERQELELKKRVVGLLDLNSDWTKTEVKEAEDGDDGDMMMGMGDALDAVAEDMRRNNEGTITPKILVTRHSKASPSPNKLMVKPSSYILSPYMNKKTKKKLFASHLRLYGHERHSKIGRLKARIPKLKWKTKANVKDCGIFTMLHMESYMGQTAKTWDCGLVAESKQQCDMLRQLRFKFATKILLHEINVHAQKMIRYAEEFDKIVGFQKMCIVVDALKNREEREKN
ncbi:hypothetical protein Tco_1576127 [Tanacetum coccineum]